ncbi:MAG: hypothetical protein WDW38_009346 [Sanguina aurantia]
MFAKLQALVGGGFTLPYNVEEEYESAWGTWTHHRGSTKDDSSRVSIFKTSAADPSDRKLVVARNGVKRLRTLRHPNILAFRDSIEVVEKGVTVIYLVTEPVKPVKLVLDELDLRGQPRDEYLSMGFLHMTNAVSFLNNSCKLIHGNVCLSAVVVTESLDWKLHGFDLLSELALPGDSALQQASWMVGKQYKPAELGKAEWEVIRESPPWAVDAWGLGCLMQEVFSCEGMQSVEDLRRTDVIPPALLSDYQKLLNSAPSRRLNPSKVAESKFLNNRLVEVVGFMENMAVKDAIDKESFFKRLPSIIPAIPAAVASRKILPLLSSALEFGGAPPVAVSSLMLIGSHLDSEEFNRRVVPCVAKLFTSAALGRTVHSTRLLETLDSYAQHLTPAVVEEQIFPQLQSGFGDAHAYIRELTLKSVLTLGPKLSSKTLNQSVLKHLNKLQQDEEPSIRANTTVLLSNIAPFLGEATCKKVLLNAFSTRALKDPFPPSRIAGLRALIATKQYYSTEDTALRILPAIAPLCIDAVSSVRQASLDCLDTFVTTLRVADSARAAELESNTDGAMGSAGSHPVTGASSMLGWAVTGLLSTVAANTSTKAGGPMGAHSVASHPVSGSLANTPRVSSSGYEAAEGSPAARASPAHAPSKLAPPPHRLPPATASASSQPAPKAPAAKDGWAAGNDDDGWDDDPLEDLEDEAEAAARKRLSSMTTHPSSSAASQRGGGAVGSSKPPTSGTSRPAATEGVSHKAVAPAVRAVAVKAVVSKPAADGWGADEDDSEAWGDMEPQKPAGGNPAAPVRTSTTASTVPRRMASSRPTSLSGSETDGGTGTAPVVKKSGGMKLGAQKLGASKLSSLTMD